MKLNQNNPGLAAETAAARFLQQQGLILVLQNYSCRYGEIDLIMREEKILVFIEVRLRSNHAFTSAASSIDYHKQQKLIRAAQHYLQHHEQTSPCRFDVILFNHTNYQSPDWIRNAIDA